MELQWPLIIFTTLVAWSAGLFAAQSLMALSGSGKRAQMPALIVSVVLLALGGIAVFFHLQHWERIFNGFGHITSGITQELIAIIVVGALMVACFVSLRRSKDGVVPRWLSGVSLASSALLVVVMAHSYMMDARPAWDSVLWISVVLGESCVLGPATMAVIMAIREEETAPIGLPAFVGSLVNVVTTAAFSLYLQMSGSLFPEVGYYIDPTRPTHATADALSAAAAQAPLLWLGAVAVGALVPVLAMIVARKKGTADAWKLWGGIAAVAALVGAVCLRVAFYELGFSVFMFY